MSEAAVMQYEIHQGVVQLDVLADLLTIIVDASERLTSKGGNNVGGWKSSDTLLSWQYPAIQATRDAIAARLGVESRALTAWAMVNRRGSFHRRHRHGAGYRVAVLYVASGDPPVPTILDVEEYAKGTLRGSGMIVRRDSVPPDIGSMVVFPGNMWHEVPRYDGDAPRVTLALEIR